MALIIYRLWNGIYRLYVQTCLYLSRFALLFATFPISLSFSVFPVYSCPVTALLCYPLFLCLCFPFCLLPSVSFLLLFYYLNVLPCSLRFLFAILLTGHNMGLQSLFKHVYNIFYFLF